MSIRVALNHKTTYTYDRPVTLSPQLIRLRPAAHCRTPITSYALKITPHDHFINWQQDPYGNYQARVVFPNLTRQFEVEVTLVADMTVINPFNFFIESTAEQYPFAYDEATAKELEPYLEKQEAGQHLARLVNECRRAGLRTTDYLVYLNQKLSGDIKYLIRMEPGVQCPEQTLELHSGSCRDTAWLMVQLLRHLGIAARFVSGYLIQLTPDIKALDGPEGPTHDFTDLHAWAEAYIPGAGWVGMDATSGLLVGEGHIPLACTAEPSAAAPISGGVDTCETEFGFHMSLQRIEEIPRSTKPYTPEQWAEIDAMGKAVDERLVAQDVRLTMGGEPTFVSIDDADAPEWNITADSPRKRELGEVLMRRLQKRFAPGALLHFGQGKWYPGEPLPRWALACYWRKDGVPVWEDHDLIADGKIDYGYGEHQAQRFISSLADRLGVEASYALPGYEDIWYYLHQERRLPTNIDPLDVDLKDPAARKKLAELLEGGLGKVVGYALPIRRARDGSDAWESGNWFLRPERMYLVPGDSPMGFRLPLDSLPWVLPEEFPTLHPRDPFEPIKPLSNPRARQQATYSTSQGSLQPPEVRAEIVEQSFGDIGDGSVDGGPAGLGGLIGARGAPSAAGLGGFGALTLEVLPRTALKPLVGQSAPWLVRTALCVEPRDGRLHIFMPPVRYVEDYLELVARIEQTANVLEMPVVIEGYTPPFDPRITDLKVTPDPGVIEVNIHPTSSWDELSDVLTGLDEDARKTGLRTEKFMTDGRHTGTGGGAHVVIGGSTPSDSPILRRPHVLRSLVGYWHNHPSLSYLFSSMFIGPTSQAPRVDEARRDMLYELETAFQQVPDDGPCAPWLVDRLFRNILVDLVGNTHRAEFCIDKLYSPDSPTGRLGLLELRGYEMQPHPQMSLTQQLLLRTMLARFWSEPYHRKLVRWGTELHDRFMLPHFVRQDFEDVIEDLRLSGLHIKNEWFDPHLEFRFPELGQIVQRGIKLELRQALEPWYVLGEEPAGGGTARGVDSSVERLQVKVDGMTDTRHVITCNGRQIPLHPTGVNGQFVAGVRYRAWQPPHCLHPNIPVHTPLTFDVVDTWNERSIGGCVYHVSHPGGWNYQKSPINALEAEARRHARFFKFGQTPGSMILRREAVNAEFPFTLDLRRK